MRSRVLIWGGFEKSTHVVAKFCAKKLSVCRFTKSVFQSSHALVQVKWRQEFECVHPSRFWNRRNFWSGFSTKKVVVKFSCCCQIFIFCVYLNLGMLGSQKVFFNLYKNLFKRNEGKSRTVFILVGSEREGIFDLGFYKKSAHVVVKFCASISLGTLGSQKVFFNLFRDLLNEMRSRVLIWGGFEKSTHVVVKFCAKKIVGMQVHKMCFWT